MREEIVICDNCRKKGEPFYDTVGWIKIEGESISLSQGRKKDGCAKTKFTNIRNKRIDLCSFQCLKEFINKGK